MVRQVAILEMEGVHDLALAAAGKELPTVRREREPVERLGQAYPVDNLRFLQIDHGNLVLAVAGMKDRQPTAAGMQRQVDRKVAQFQLLAGGTERPLVG